MNALQRVTSVPAWLYLSLMVAVGTALRFWDIAQSSIWHDEGFTMMLAPMSPAQIIARTGRDVHPPLYYLVLHYWMLVFGNSETAARGLSAGFMIAAIPLAYLLVRRLWSEGAARWAALFVAAGPFVIRYSQEARMYGMVAFLLLLATYLLLRALESNTWKWWLAYALVFAAAFYTHYYAVFMVVVHWLYVLTQTDRRQHKPRRQIWNPRWWISNVVIVALFLPWLPVAYSQFTRVQAAFWIPKVTATTMPSTMFQFLAFGSGDVFSHRVLVGLGLLFVALVGAALVWLPRRRSALWLLACYTLVGPVLVFMLSFKRPIYVDRYFVFAAVGFYCLIGVLVASLPRRWLQAVAAVAVLAVFGLGVSNVHQAANHKMRVIGAYVSDNFQPGDEVISGELYTFFDFSYYNHTGATVHLWSKNGVNGYNESSLFYDRADVVVRQLDSVHPASGHVWMVGKTGYQQYFDPKVIPAGWRAIGPKITAGYCAVQEYRVP